MTVTGVTASPKVYDRTITATINTGSAALSGVFGTDNVTLDKTGATGSFGDKTAANNKTVTISGFALSGTDAGNYTLTQPTATANITPEGLTITGVTADNKVYDAGATATLNTGSKALDGVVPLDTVTLGGTPTASFADKTVANNKPVTISGFTISGADAANYTLTQPSATANITARNLTVTAAATNRTYDGTLNVSVTLSTDKLGTDGISTTYTSCSFDTRNAGNGKTVSVMGISINGGADAGNYYLASPTATTTANISARPVTVTAVTDTKTYNGNNSSSGAPTITLGSLGTGDSATYSQTFDNKNAGTGKTLNPSVTINDGNGGANYAVSYVTNTTGVINKKDVTVTGVTASPKVYDGSTTATLNTGSAACSGWIPGDDVWMGLGSITVHSGDKCRYRAKP